MSVILLAGFAFAPVVFAEKARFFSSKGSSAFKSRARDVKMDTGRSLLSTAKSASGVGASIHPTASSKLDEQSSRRLLEMFDRKKNWVFHGLGGDDEEKEDIISEDNWTNGEKQLFRDPYRRSNGVVKSFIQGDEQNSPDKNGGKRNSRQKDPTRLRPEEDEEDRLNRDETKLDLGLTQRVERTGLAFSGNSPFSTRTGFAGTALDSERIARAGFPPGGWG